MYLDNIVGAFIAHVREYPLTPPSTPWKFMSSQTVCEFDRRINIKLFILVSLEQSQSNGR